MARPVCVSVSIASVRDLESINNPGEEMILQISRSPASTYLTVFQSSGVSLSPDLLMLSYWESVTGLGRGGSTEICQAFDRSRIVLLPEFPMLSKKGVFFLIGSWTKPRGRWHTELPCRELIQILTSFIVYW